MAPTPTASTLPATVRPSATADVTRARPALSADENLVTFNDINTDVVVANPKAKGRDFIDALVAAGFDKSKMQVTADQNTVGGDADSVTWSIEFNGKCLLGQYGPESGGYHGVVMPVLANGGCLIGNTRPIDW
ncbi:MAG TPA: hypothetical protein VFU07_08125 [Candidatus Lumbricidophila sp.]|nr:hypothetical protein [Candidatus Lumbricidophila sp.]